MKAIHAILAVFLCQAAVPIGLLFSPWFLAAFLGRSPNIQFTNVLQSLDMTAICWLISVPISIILGFPLVLYSLINNKLSIKRALYINVIVSAFPTVLLCLMINLWEMWFSIAIPVCIFGTVILALYFKKYSFLARTIPMYSMAFLIVLTAFLFIKIDFMNLNEVEMRSYMTLDREMAKQIEADRKK